MFRTITYRQDQFSSRPFSFSFFFFKGGRGAWDTIDNIVYVSLHGCDVAGLGFSRDVGGGGSCPSPLGLTLVYARRQY